MARKQEQPQEEEATEENIYHDRPMGKSEEEAVKSLKSEEGWEQDWQKGWDQDQANINEID